MKKKRTLWRISVTTSREAEEAVSEWLGLVSGCAASAYHHLESGVSLVSVFSDTPFPNNFRKKIQAGLVQIKNCGLATGAGRIKIGRIKREDWAESWKRHFHPLSIGRTLLVKPGWSKQRPLKNQAVVVLDPGLSFGTGQHPTTAFCLAELVRCQKPGTRQSFLDIGTGSGILAIAAAKLGYAPVEAFDLDPEAVRVARENARKNGVATRIQLTRGDVSRLTRRPGHRFDVVCANLVSTLLMAERRRLLHRLQPSATLVLAGILAVEFDDVRRAFAGEGMKLIAERTENEWRSGSFCFV